MNFKIRIRTPRHTPSPFWLFDWPSLSEDTTRERFEQAVSARLAAAEINAGAEPLGFSALKNAIHAAATEVIPKLPRASVTPTRDLPAIQAGRSLAAILNVSPSRIMPAVYQQELEKQLVNLCSRLEDSFDGNKSGLAYKIITDIEGNALRRQLGPTGTPSEVKQQWELHFTHLFRQEDGKSTPQGASVFPVNHFTGPHGEDSLQIARSHERDRLQPRSSYDAGELVSGLSPLGSLLSRFDAPISRGRTAVATAPEQGNHVANLIDPSPADPFTEEELDAVLRQSSSSSSPGLDGLPYSVFQLHATKSTLLSVCNRVLHTGVAPPDWVNSAIVPLFKKGDPNLPSNYRGIALMSTAAKLFNKMILKRVRDLVDQRLRPNQNGFRAHRSCPQHILALRRVIENCQVYQKQSAVIAFIDFKKAFDSIHRSYLVETLTQLEIPIYLIKAIMSLYWESTVQVVTSHGLTDPIPVRRGVLQGDTLAPYLFVLVLDRVMQTALVDETMGYCVRERRSSRHPGRFVTDLTFADDIALLAQTFEHADLMLQAVALVGREAGLEINVDKTKVLVIGDLARLNPDEVTRRINQAASNTGRLQKVWAAPL